MWYNLMIRPGDARTIGVVVDALHAVGIEVVFPIDPRDLTEVWAEAQGVFEFAGDVATGRAAITKWPDIKASIVEIRREPRRRHPPL